jgi:hypothetical protein
MTTEEAKEILKKCKADKWQLEEIWKSGGQGYTFKFRNTDSGERGRTI